MTTRDLTHPWGRSDEFRRASQGALPLVFLRANAALFYSLGTALLLEGLAPACADRIAGVFPEDRAFHDWLRIDWAPRRVARTHRLREYLALTWPEFDSTGAQERYTRTTGAQPPAPPASPAHEALRRCTAASQSALFYRCLAQWAEDVELRRIAGDMACEDVAAFARFREKYESSAKRERLSIWKSWRSTDALVREARDRHVQCAFLTLVAQWGPNAPFHMVAYAEFVTRMRAVIERYGELAWIERFVLRAWTGAPFAITDGVVRRRLPSFRPIFAPDAGDSVPAHYYSWGLPACRRD